MRTSARLYIAAILIIAALFSIAAFLFSAPSASPLWLFFVLALATALMRVFTIDGPNFRSFEGSTITLIASILLLPPWQFILIVILSHSIEWAKERWMNSPLLRKWYIQPFNMAKVILGGLVAYEVVQATGLNVSDSLHPGTLLSVLIVVLAYVAVNQLLLAGVLYLARGIRFRDAGIIRDGLLIELPLASIGYIVAYMVSANPLLGLFALAPIVMIYQAFMLPKLQFQAMQSLEKANQEMSKANESIQQLNQELFLTVAKIFDARDPYVGGHAAQVAAYAIAIARELGLPSERVETIRQAALLHDIGKIAFPEAILHKPGALTPSESDLMKKHPDIGADFLATGQGLKHLAPIIRHHHERWDGKGYPNELAGEAIPLESRILNLADSIEAMASDRPYHRAMSIGEIIQEIKDCSGNQFDPQLVDTFIRIAEREGPGLIVNSARQVAAQYALTGLTVEGFPLDMFARRYLLTEVE